MARHMTARQAFFWGYGWIWGRWWQRFICRASWWHWWHVFGNSLWPKRGALVDYPIRCFLVRAMRATSCKCPHCGYDAFTEHDDLFVCEDGGTNSTPDGISHWWRGLQTCARCRTTHEHGDST